MAGPGGVERSQGAPFLHGAENPERMIDSMIDSMVENWGEIKEGDLENMLNQIPDRNDLKNRLLIGLRNQYPAMFNSKIPAEYKSLTQGERKGLVNAELLIKHEKFQNASAFGEIKHLVQTARERDHVNSLMREMHAQGQLHTMLTRSL